MDIEQRSNYCFVNNLPRPAINMYCKNCDSIQTYNMENQYNELDRGNNYTFWEKILRVEYQCSSCRQNYFYFYLEFTKIKEKTKSGSNYDCGHIRKVGQAPPWEIKTDKNIDKLLGEHADYFNKGLINESQSYGIGAFAYYRRITEVIIDDLLDQIEVLVPTVDKAKYQEALEETKKTRQAEEKIKLVENLLPDTLKPERVNPLAILYSTLSEGLHSDSDEKCLECADKIRKSLVYLVNSVLKQKEENLEYSVSLKGLLDEKSKAIAKKKEKELSEK